MFNDKFNKGFRRKLRNELSPVEAILWSRLKGRQLKGHKFRRQHGIGSFVVDFFCPRVKLVIEIDGEEHFLTKEREDKDQLRDQFLKARDVTVLHVTGKDVNENIEGVIERILDYLS